MFHDCVMVQSMSRCAYHILQLHVDCTIKLLLNLCIGCLQPICTEPEIMAGHQTFSDHF